MKRFAKSIVFLALFQFLVTNSGKSQEKSWQMVSCLADTAEHYAIYFPRDFDTSRTFGMLIFLDPSARGDVPVQLYQELADEYRLVLAGSMRSRNFSGDVSLRSFVAIYNDLLQRINPDTSVVFLSGFSGGARVAATIAALYPEVTGVIACGAGFTGTDESSIRKIRLYAATVGYRDMNYEELVENTSLLDELGMKNMLVYFDGVHEWAPAGSMKMAIQWLMESKSNPVLQTGYPDTQYIRRLNQLEDSGRLCLAWQAWSQLKQVSRYRQQAAAAISRLEGLPGFKKDREEYESSLKSERTIMNAFSIAYQPVLAGMNINDETKWRELAAEIKEMRSEKSYYRQLSAIRATDHCRRSCGEYFFMFMETKEYDVAIRIATIMEYFVPDEPAVQIWMARAYAGLGNKKQTLHFLKLAAKAGYTQPAKLFNDVLLLKVITADEIRQVFEQQ
ncbi:MAG: alpha/beta hydrolase [Chitinophagaceae bacterium]|nr:alpha/beta hydrolase [Chitinophagaceae bacterium]